MFILISYDVSDDKRRTKIHKTLKSYGQRVQYSVFECELNQMDYVRLRYRLERLIHRDEDNIRFYMMCSACQLRIERIGGVQPLDELGIFVG